MSFVCEEAVNEAIGQLNGFQAGDCTLKVSRARGRQETPAQTGAMVSPFGSRPQQSPAVNGQSGLPGHGISPFQTSPPPASSHNIPTNPPQLGLQGAPGRVSVSATLLPNQPAASFSSLFSGMIKTVGIGLHVLPNSVFPLLLKIKGPWDPQHPKVEGHFQNWGVPSLRI